MARETDVSSGGFIKMTLIVGVRSIVNIIEQ